MGSADLIYKEKFKQALKEAHVHLLRIEEAFEELMKNTISSTAFIDIVVS